MTDDMHHHLTELGSLDAPAPDTAFADHLELQLRDMRAAGPASGAAIRRWPATVAAVAFSVAVIAFGLSTIQPGVQMVRISSASEAQVHLPNGSVVEAEPGLEIPEGAWVEVGPSGSASIGELVIGPGQVAEVTPEGVVLAEIIDGDPVPITVPNPNVVSRTSDAAAPTTGDDAGVAAPPSTEPSVVETNTPSSTDGAATDSTAPEETAPPESPSSDETVPGSEATTTTVTDDTTTTEEPTTTTEPSTTTSATTTTVADDTTTSRPTSTLPPESTTSSSAPSTTVGSSTTLPGDNGTTTTSADTTLPNPTIPEDSTTTTTTTEKPSEPTTTLPHDPVLGNIMGELRVQLLPCEFTDAVLLDLAQAVIDGVLTQEQAQILLDC